jgi:hypothetical protein
MTSKPSPYYQLGYNASLRGALRILSCWQALKAEKAEFFRGFDDAKFSKILETKKTI